MVHEPPAVMVHEPAVLIEGVLFRARYLGSTQLVSEGQPNKTTRMMQAEEAVTRIKVRRGGRLRQEFLVFFLLILYVCAVYDIDFSYD